MSFSGWREVFWGESAGVHFHARRFSHRGCIGAVLAGHAAVLLIGILAPAEHRLRRQRPERAAVASVEGVTHHPQMVSCEEFATNLVDMRTSSIWLKLTICHGSAAGCRARAAGQFRHLPQRPRLKAVSCRSSLPVFSNPGRKWRGRPMQSSGGFASTTE